MDNYIHIPPLRTSSISLNLRKNKSNSLENSKSNITTDVRSNNGCDSSIRKQNKVDGENLDLNERPSSTPGTPKKLIGDATKYPSIFDFYQDGASSAAPTPERIPFFDGRNDSQDKINTKEIYLEGEMTNTDKMSNSYLNQEDDYFSEASFEFVSKDSVEKEQNRIEQIKSKSNRTNDESQRNINDDEKMSKNEVKPASKIISNNEPSSGPAESMNDDGDIGISLKDAGVSLEKSFISSMNIVKQEKSHEESHKKNQDNRSLNKKKSINTIKTTGTDKSNSSSLSISNGNKGESAPGSQRSRSLKIKKTRSFRRIKKGNFSDSAKNEAENVSAKKTISNDGATSLSTTSSGGPKEEKQLNIKSPIILQKQINESEIVKLPTDRDRYGFKKQNTYVSEVQYNEWISGYEQYLLRRKKKWENLLLHNGLNLNHDSPTRFPPRSNKLTRYVRKGIPAEWRGNAWWYFSKGDEKLDKNQGVYDKLVQETVDVKCKDAELIERDLNRTFPDNYYFRDPNSDSSEESPLIKSLRRVLLAFAKYQPKIGYCQSLNFLAGLLLIFLNEEKTFWMLVIITSRLLPGVHDINLEGVNIDQAVLMLCVEEYLPNTWKKIGFNFDETAMANIGKKHPGINNVVNTITRLPPVTLCTASWFMSAFIVILPIETCLRVWDCFFFEGSQVFFQISLGIFKILEPKILEVKDEMEIFQIIQHVPKEFLDPTELFDICFNKRRSGNFSDLTQSEITRCREFVVSQREKATRNLIKKGSRTTNDQKSDGKEKELEDGIYVVDKKQEKIVEDADVLQHLTREFDENFIPDVYDFHNHHHGLAGLHWKRNLRRKLKMKNRVRVQ